jgi:hypothetical protein
MPETLLAVDFFEAENAEVAPKAAPLRFMISVIIELDVV